MFRLAVPLGVVVAVSLVAGLPRAADHTAAGSPEPFDHTKLRTMGVGSCASMACHHGNGAPGELGSEYSTWIATDPHAKAYRVLFNPESLRMQKNLEAHDSKHKGFGGPHENPLCLKCHGMGDCVPERFQADGVGCERCHGPAERWKATHYMPGFDRSHTPGFKDLRTDMTVRIETCLACHVGQGEQQVDHDLIAAGHPRLRFDYAAYYASYPRHWGAKHKGVVEDEYQSWILGELSSAKAALELLAYRAGNAAGEWPEFAEYECAACHQQLKADSKGRPGVLPWGTWYTAVLPAVADGRPADFLKKRDAIKEAMGKRRPSRELVRREAMEAARMLGEWRDGVRGRSPDAASVRALMATLADKAALADSWDGGMQLYLSLAALNATLGEKQADTSALREPMLKMKNDLADAFPKGRVPLYDSPVDYSPEKLRQALEQLRRRLE